MYCNNCGSEMADDAKFCPKCGKEAGAQPRASGTHGVAYTEKSVGLAVVLSLIIVGAGQMYAGKVGRGIAILLFSLFGIGVLYVPLFLAPSVGTLALGSILVIAWYVFVVYDAYKQAKNYNEYLNRNGRPPW